MTEPCKICGRDNEDATHTALEAFGHLNHEYIPNRPEIVVLCGSTRFHDEFRRQNLRLTIEGKIVLSIGCDTKSDGDLFGQDDVEALKVRLDKLHKHKINLADRVLVLNVGGYIGESTRSEINHALAAGKPIDYLEPIARLRELPGGHLRFLCPGCNDWHVVNSGWTWNGSTEAPTLNPSVLVTYPAVPDASDEFAEWRTERHCHSLVRDGQIEFLSDSTHWLAGQTAELLAEHPSDTQ